MKKLFFLIVTLQISLTCFTQQPTIYLNSVDSGCVGKIFPFTAYVYASNDSALSFAWDFGDGSPMVVTDTNSINHQYNSVGIFDVHLIVTLQVYGPHTITVPGMIRTGTAQNAHIDSLSETICFKSGVQFHDLSTGIITGWLWSFGDGGVSTDQNPIHEYNIDTSGTVDPFDIVLTVFNNGCPDTDSVLDVVTVLGPMPFFQINYDCEKRDSFMFFNLSGGDNQYSWDFGDGSPVSNDINPFHIFPGGGGAFLVTLTATNSSSGCIVDTMQPIQFMPHVMATISESNGALISSVSSPAYNYNWYCNGQFISNYPGPFCVPVQTGNYYVLIFDPFTGCHDTSAYYSFTVGVQNIYDNSIVQIYPNPLNGSLLHLSCLNCIARSAKIEIWNVFGEAIFPERLIDITSSEIDLSEICAGIYFVLIDYDNGRRIFKLVRN